MIRATVKGIIVLAETESRKRF